MCVCGGGSECVCVGGLVCVCGGGSECGEGGSECVCGGSVCESECVCVYTYVLNHCGELPIAVMTKQVNSMRIN